MDILVLLDYLKFGQVWLAYYAIQEKDRNNYGEYSYMAQRLLSLLIEDYKLHSIACCINWLLRYNVTLNRQVQGTLPLAGYTLFRALTICEGGCSLTWCYIKPTGTGRSTSGRLPLIQGAHNPWGGCSLIWCYTKPTGTGHTSLWQATRYIGCSRSVRWLLLNNTWGLTLRSGLVCKAAERTLTFAITHKTQTARPGPPWLL